MTRFISNKTVVHFDLICLITFFALNVDQFAWSLRPYLPDHSFPVVIRPLCVMTYSNTKQTAWSVRVRVTTNLPDHFDLICLITHSPFRPICVITCSNTKLCSLQPYLPVQPCMIPLHILTSPWVSTNLPDHVDLICLITYSSSHFGWFARWLVRTQNYIYYSHTIQFVHSQLLLWF